ncbi:uncharacterized protein E0L32_006415 [Thyridium curvatum]|uniref:Polycomb protein VEFS-Box domain-containing protein n=1 Tax=Thyridium curvatum TaxID=1093900 RepID=A0A507AQS7_9PEZI|nr:uncharacterized protein E0L32_006415 [Thyridium curvatum]TPX13215.1 hypothetical protein E0L32_006415 [Thyridium curvatum]
MAAFSSQHRLPFLHRNWITALNSWQNLGSKPSPPSATPGHEPLKEEFDMGFYSRPAKRRRVTESTPVSLSDPDTSLTPEQSMDQSYGQVQGSPNHADDIERALRVDILKIEHRESSRVKFDRAYSRIGDPTGSTDALSTQARCRITIFCERQGGLQILHCDSQICTLKAFKNPVGPSQMARVYGAKPFIIPKDKILIMREDDAVFDLADSYTLQVELESAGAADWPPINVISPVNDVHMFSQRSVPPRHWVLCSTVYDLFGPARSHAPVKLRKGPQQGLSTDFVMTVDARWTTGFSQSLVNKHNEKGVLPSITVFDPNEKIPEDVNGHGSGVSNGTNGLHEVNGVNGDGMVLDDDDEEMDGELTPSRSLRTRGGDKVYNLKVLSDKAQGKERRKRRKLEKLAKAGNSITYFFPEEHFPVDGFVCCLCLAPTQNLTQLRAHFLSHPNYQFDLEGAGGRGGLAIAVSHSTERPGSPLWPKVYQLGRATKPLDLDKLIDGDESWVTSRYGPDNDAPTKPTVARVPQKLSTRRKDNSLVVPRTKQPLFDFLSKALLEPGSEIRPVVADDTWLINKHRDTVQDFSDVDPPEKEYIKEWDAFVLRKRISSDAYIPRAMLAFVTEKAQWLVESPSRTIEFGKHLSVLIARNVLDNQTVSDALARIAEARSKLEDRNSNLKPTASSPKESPYKSCNGCTVCGLPVRGPSLLICSNKVSIDGTPVDRVAMKTTVG